MLKVSDPIKSILFTMDSAPLEIEIFVIEYGGHDRETISMEARMPAAGKEAIIWERLMDKKEKTNAARIAIQNKSAEEAKRNIKAVPSQDSTGIA